MEICSGDFAIAYTSKTCRISIRGMPSTKYQCLVLWWNTRMPMMEPTLQIGRAHV